MIHKRNMKIIKNIKEREKICGICGATESLMAHHIWPLEYGGPDTEDNLMVMCETCHNNIHIVMRCARDLRMIAGNDEELKIKINQLTAMVFQSYSDKCKQKKEPSS